MFYFSPRTTVMQFFFFPIEKEINAITNKSWISLIKFKFI